MFKNLRWKLILVISVISTITLIIGFVSALSISSAPPKELSNTDNDNNTEVEKPNATEDLDKNNYNILVLGDSLAKGTGDEKGIGFPGYFSDFWKTKTSKEIKINNLAVNGDVSSGLLRRSIGLWFTIGVFCPLSRPLPRVSSSRGEKHFESSACDSSRRSLAKNWLFSSYFLGRNEKKRGRGYLGIRRPDSFLLKTKM